MKKKRLIALFMTLCMLVTIVGIVPMSAEETEIKLTRDNVVEAVNGQGSEQYYFIDQQASGNAQWTTVEVNSDNRLVIDLKKETEVGTIKITYGNDQGRVYGCQVFYATGDTAPAANDAAWTEIKNTGKSFTYTGKTEGWWSGVKEPIEIPANVKARFIKITGLGRTAGSGDGPQTNIAKLQVFEGTSSASNNASTGTTTDTDNTSNTNPQKSGPIELTRDNVVEAVNGKGSEQYYFIDQQASGNAQWTTLEVNSDNRIIIDLKDNYRVGTIKITYANDSGGRVYGSKVFYATGDTAPSAGDASWVELTNPGKDFTYTGKTEGWWSNTGRPVEIPANVTARYIKITGLGRTGAPGEGPQTNIGKLEVIAGGSGSGTTGTPVGPDVTPPESDEEEIVLPPVKQAEGGADVGSASGVKEKKLTTSDYTDKFANSTQNDSVTINGAFDGVIDTGNGVKWTTHANEKGLPNGEGDKLMAAGHESDTIIYGGAKIPTNKVTSVKVYSDGRGVNQLKGIKVFTQTKALKDYSQAELDALPTYGKDTSGVKYSVSSDSIPNLTVGWANFSFATPVEGDTVVVVYERRKSGADWVNTFEIEVSVADESETPGATSSVSSDKEVNLLTALGIVVGYEDGTFKPEEEITRAEFVTMVARMMMGGDESIMSTPEEDVFSDVPTSHWASKYVKLGKEQGYLDGFGDGTFKPDENVTYEQAVKVLVCATGYDFMAKAYGGYPAGYLNVASRNGLLKNVKAVTGENALRGQIAKLMYNTLFADLATVETIDGYNATMQTGKTIITSLFDVKKYSGKVTASVFSTLVGDESGLTYKQLEIGGEVFRTINPEDAYLLGYMVDAYVKEEGNDKVLLLVYANDTNESITLKKDDISEINATFTKITTENEDTGRKTNYSIKGTPTVILNGIAMTGDLDALRTSKGGANFDEITLVSTEGGSAYDTIFVIKHEYGVVTASKTSSSEITYKYVDENGVQETQTVACDEAKSNNVVLIYKNGELAEVKDIKKDDRIVVERNGKYYTIYASDSTVEGEITKIRGDYVTIDGTEYEIQPGAKSYANLAVGKNIKAYLTATGEIYYADKNDDFTTSLDYALLIFAKISDEEELTLRIMDDSGAINTYTASGKLTFNGVKDVPYEEIIASLETTGIKSQFGWADSTKNNRRRYEQVVLVKMDSDNAVKTLVTTAADDEITGGDKLTPVIAKNRSVSGGKISIDGKSYTIASAPTFFVPEEGAADDKLDYSVGTLGSGDKGSSNYMLFNSTKIGKPQAILNAGGSSQTKVEVKYDQSAAVITDIEKVIIKDDGDFIESYSFTFLRDGAEHTYTLSSDAYMMGAQSKPIAKGETIIENFDKINFSKGDFIYYHLNSDGEIDGIKLVVSMYGSPYVDPAWAAANKNIKVIPELRDGTFVGYKGQYGKIGDADVYESYGGTVTAMEDNQMNMVCNNQGYLLDIAGPVYVYDVAEDEVVLGSESDIEEGSVIIVNSIRQSLKAILVITNYEE